MPSSQSLEALIEALAEQLLADHLWLVTAESCTGGGIAAACTEVAGSSGWFAAGIVTYTETMKQRLLGVDAALLAQHGAVSEPVARAMAEGALTATGADFAVSVTGIAGPGGGEVLQPVGTVWFGWAQRGVRTETAVERFDGTRAAIRSQAVLRSLSGAVHLLQS